MGKMISFFVCVVLAGGLLLTNPTTEDFAEYIIDTKGAVTENLFSGLATQEVENETKVQNYRLFTIFSYDGERYLGVFTQFISKGKIKETVDEKLN